MVRDELEVVLDGLRQTIISTIPTLEQAANYFFRKGIEGKKVRPTVILLFSGAFADMPSTSLPSPEIFIPGPVQNLVTTITNDQRYTRQKQRRLAQIAEMIHVASLMHDDVIDDASQRRGVMSLNNFLGNKHAILAGDFLLARASVLLATLGNNQVVGLMAEVLDNLVSGEIMQLNSNKSNILSLDHYLKKTYYKTAALIANSSMSVAVLSGQTPQTQQLAWTYGKNLGIAFQIIDDILDFTQSSQALGKPALNDLKEGLTTAPVLFAIEQHPQLKDLALRKYRHEGDVEQAYKMVSDSQGIQKAKDLAIQHVQESIDAIDKLPKTQNKQQQDTRNALIKIASIVINRIK